MNKKEAIKIADEYFEAGKHAYVGNEYLKAVQFADSAMELFSYFEDNHKICATLNLKGKILAGRGNETASLEKFLEGLELAEKESYEDMITIFYNNIGFRYEYIDQFDKAIDYYNKAYEHFLKIDKINMNNYNKMGIKLSINFFDMYMHKDDMVKVERYYKDILYYLNKVEDKEIYKIYSGALIIRESILAWTKKDFDTMNLKLKKIMILLKKRFFDDYIWCEYPTLVEFLLESGNYEECEFVIAHFLQEAINKNDMEAMISAAKFQMNLFKKEKKNLKYQEACVKYVELLKDKDDLTKKEKGYALDFKIAIRKIDEARKKAENLLGIDSLTNIRNRYALYKDAKELMNYAYSNELNMVLGILDIDEFKSYNDRLGHIGGDQILKMVASNIKEIITGYGSVYRLGGDEFIILCKQLETVEVEIFADNIKEKLKENSVSISQGYVRFSPKKGEEIDQIIERADKLLYQIKNQGKDNFAIIDIDCK